MERLINESVDTNGKIKIAINCLTDMKEWSDRIGSDELTEIGFVVELLRKVLKESNVK